MSLETINTGTVVDDSTGDYLRVGATKINDNFTEIYTKFGDGSDLYPAGFWDVFTVATDSTTYTLSFGENIDINTTAGSATLTLPTGSSADYGKSICIRDPYGVWATNPVTVTPGSTDTMKGSSNSVEFSTKWQILRFVYTSPSRWEYQTQTRLDGVYLGDSPSIIIAEFLATADQTDFSFYDKESGDYNTTAVEVYLRGNLLYYGDELNSLSDYGSVPDDTIDTWAASTDYVTGDTVKVANSSDDWDYDYYEATSSFTSGTTFTSSNWTQLNVGALVPLDGQTIRLAEGAAENDPVTIKTYQSDVSSFQTAVQEGTIRIITSSNLSDSAIDGEVVQIEDDQDTLTLTDFGFDEYTEYNADHFALWLNGTKLLKAGDAGTTETDDDEDPEYEYALVDDDNDLSNTIKFSSLITLKEDDIINIQWFASKLGTLLSWDDDGDTETIKSYTDERYLQNTETITRSGNIEYSDPTDPSADTTSTDDTETDIRITNITSLFKSIYPVGSLYFNAHNATNPANIIGFGTWVRFAEGKAIVGWEDQDSDGNYNSTFSYNPQYTDDDGNAMPVAGGTIGSSTVTLTASNIPPLTSGLSDSDDWDDTDDDQQYALVSRSSDGDISLSGCQADPDSTTTTTTVYAEEPITVNTGVTASAFSVIQPSILVNIWIRTE